VAYTAQMRQARRTEDVCANASAAVQLAVLNALRVGVPVTRIALNVRTALGYRTAENE